ncbi:MAG: hypothetical protein H8E55_72845 [Pelagibacterales bacterium]|nr:hypothetical protein [Pelagibacterales bacterium]
MPIIDNMISTHASKIGFLFISWMVVASGYVTQVLPCQTQNYLQNGTLGKHLIGWLICFLFIMLEGGWSFNMDEQNKSDVDWSNGNVKDTLIFGGGLYLAFLLTAKMKLIPNMILYLLLFGVYLINTQRLYWEKRELITKEENDQMINLIKICLGTSLLVFGYGFVDYFIYKKKSFGKQFSTFEFLFSGNKCASVN